MNRIALVILKNLFKVPGMYLKLKHYAAHTDEYPDEEKYRHIQKILKMVIDSGNIDLRVTGTEYLRDDEAYMLYSNHQGLFDVVAIAATCDPPIGAVLKKELYDVALLRYISQCTHSFPMDREDVRQSLTVIQGVTERLKQGCRYLLFPEGTRSRKGNEMLEFHGGSFRCAVKAKVKVIPIAVYDSFKVLDQKGSAPVTVYLDYLKPIEPEEYAGMKTQELAALVKARIQEKLDEHARALS